MRVILDYIKVNYTDKKKVQVSRVSDIIQAKYGIFLDGNYKSISKQSLNLAPPIGKIGEAGLILTTIIGDMVLTVVRLHRIRVFMII